MSKILLQIKNNKLLIQEKKRLKVQEKSLVNTNVISQNELLFSEEYINENKTLIHNFVKELVTTYNIDTLIIREFRITTLMLNVLQNISNLQYLYLLEEDIVTYKICEAIANTNTIKYVSLYNIPTFLLEL